MFTLCQVACSRVNTPDSLSAAFFTTYGVALPLTTLYGANFLEA